MCNRRQPSSKPPTPGKVWSLDPWAGTGHPRLYARPEFQNPGRPL